MRICLLLFLNRSIFADVTNFLDTLAPFPNLLISIEDYVRVTGNLSMALPIMVACGLTFKPLLSKGANFWRKITGSKHGSSDHVDTIGHARQNRDHAASWEGADWDTSEQSDSVGNKEHTSIESKEKVQANYMLGEPYPSGG